MSEIEKKVEDIKDNQDVIHTEIINILEIVDSLNEMIKDIHLNIKNIHLILNKKENYLNKN
mgnify:CR=1 FL=1|tara:strand:- start:360 stop:542 length:183 start_codon:yes stop_codon:yes gene_type:complete